jgi:cytochrome c553
LTSRAAELPRAEESITAAPEAVEFFETRVRPILAESCLRCHGEKKQSSELRVDGRRALLEGGANGPAVVPGNPDESLLIQVVRRTHEEIKMPPKGKLPDEAIETLAAWVKMGAPWSPEQAIAPPAEPTVAAGTHWAFQPVRPVAPPQVSDPSWVATPVDAFVLARLEQAGLRASPRADRRTLIRRATFDLTGLPPTPGEIAAFEADTASHSEAFARVVDRLLASPHYGERWGRHWLDVARYADTRGYVVRGERRYPYSYTYRDYVIRSFNEDRPFDRFVVEQIAADQLDLGADRRPLAALGFLTLGRRFLSDINEIIDDRIDVVGRGLLGLTIACARCHDHKFDPIPTEDYYSLHGVFASSFEPEELPVIAGIEQPSEATRDFQRQLKERESARDAHALKLRDAYVEDIRSRLALYLKAAYALDFNPRHVRLDELSRAEKLPPNRVRSVITRWQAQLEATRGKGKDKDQFSPVFTPWHAFAALPASQFASRAEGLAQSLLRREPPVNPVLARSFAESPPAAMADVVARYAELLGEAESRWQDRHMQAPEAQRLDDQDWEALRQVLYSESGPIAIGIATLTSKASLRLVLDRKEREEFEAVQSKILELQVSHPGAPPRAMVLEDAATPTNPQVFIRGIAARPGKSVPRQFLAVLSGPDRKPFAHGSGRLELAQAIVRPENPLTARVMINRVWLNHFGSGLVATPSDFGLRSEPPTHPELLDYLAGAFVRGGWSVKALHRLIMLSNTYQQQSRNRPECIERDPQNLLLWRFNRRRLDFESLRDALLAVSGELDPTVGGRPVPLTTTPFTTRRTVYGFVDRQNLDVIYRTFDFASPDATSPRRYVTTVPQQALFLMNNPFTLEQAQHLAERVASESSSDPEIRVRRLYERLLGRAPEADELALGLAFTRRQPESAAWQEYAQVLLLTNEFAFVD